MKNEIINGSSKIKKVLVAEEDQLVREYIHELFSINGYEVKSISSAAEALRILGIEYFPVVLTELFFKDRQGLEILDYIRRQDICTAVIVVTTHRSIDSLNEAFRLGAYDYINKPFITQVLLHRVAQAVEHIQMKKIISSGTINFEGD